MKEKTKKKIKENVKGVVEGVGIWTCYMIGTVAILTGIGIYHTLRENK